MAYSWSFQVGSDPDPAEIIEALRKISEKLVATVSNAYFSSEGGRLLWRSRPEIYAHPSCVARCSFLIVPECARVLPYDEVDQYATVVDLRHVPAPSEVKCYDSPSAVLRS
jgi:hypothetical protein